MDDLIKRQDAIEAIRARSYKVDTTTDNGEYFWEGLVISKDIIEHIPSAQKKGHWELAEDGWYCTACELYPPFNCDPEEKGIPYCPNCGADMRGDEDR